MSTAERRRRDREAREALFLDTAAHLVLERGYLGMNMDLIAAATEYSKGTLYQHFSSKEDVLAALTERMAVERVRLFEQAATFRGRPRERMAAIGLSLDLFAALHPTYVRLEPVLTDGSIRAKLPDSRRDSLLAQESSCVSIVAGIVRDGISTGDLVLPEDTTPETLVAGLWMVTYGGMSILSAEIDKPMAGFDSLPDVLHRTQNAILDGYGWRPLFPDWDYDATRRRALQEVFPDEARQAGLR